MPLIHRPALAVVLPTAVLALVYAGLGALGLMLAIPPGYASPVFPAAGLALAASLWWGPRALAGVWLGSAMLNLVQTWHQGSLAPSTLFMVAAIASGAAAQAWAGRWLVRRWQGDAWRALERERDALRFLLLGGVLACLVSASVGVSSLRVAEVLEPGEFFFTWWTWYVGDALGVLVFAPLTLCLLQQQDGLWRERRRRIGIPMLLTLSLAVLVFYGASRWEAGQQSRQLEFDGDALAKRIGDRLIAHKEILSSLRNFVESMPDLSFAQFEHFTRNTLKDNPDISALSFNDLVPNERRAEFERMAGVRSPLGMFQITERDSQRRLVRAAPRPEYVAVRYIAPMAGNEPAVGFDIRSEAVRRDAIRRATASGSWTVAAPIQLVQEQSTRPGMLQLLPVAGPAAGAGGQGGTPLGFAVSVVKVDQMVEIATRGRVPPGLVFQLSDPSAADTQQAFYRSATGGDALQNAGQAVWRTSLSLGDRVWDLSVHATKSYQRSHRPWAAWGVGVVGLMFAALLQVLMLGMTGSTAALRRKRSELVLAEKVFDSSGEGIVVVDRWGQVLSANPAFSKVTGYSAEQAVGLSLPALLADRHSPDFLQGVQHAIKHQDGWQGEVWGRRRNGEMFPAWLTLVAVRGPERHVTHIVGTFADIGEYKAAQDQIRFLALHDPLTGLPNRLLGQDHVQQAITHAQRRGTKMAVLSLGLDEFKLVNDSYGHGIGDELLKAVAQRLQTRVRETATLGRLAGDEFLILLEETGGYQEVSALCEQILQRVFEPFSLGERQLSVSASIGVAIYPEDGSDAESLLKAADAAMYEAKKLGRHTFCFYDKRMNADTFRYVQLRDALRLALERQEFELHYQPQIGLASGEVVGVEALIRWRHPEQGLLSPGHFIPVAEDSGLIVPIGEWVLGKACRQAAQWREAGLNFGAIGVNLSAAQFQRGNLEQLIVDSLSGSGVDPAQLELELTESILIQDEERVLATVRRLKALGVRLAIDDFGTGYSSLAYLKRFTVDRLKIDQSFVRGIVDDTESRAIVQAIVQMAKSFKLRCLAEGVEHEAVQDLLRELGCDEVQGYLHARPMAAAEFADFLRERNQDAGRAPSAKS